MATWHLFWLIAFPLINQTGVTNRKTRPIGLPRLRKKTRQLIQLWLITSSAVLALMNILAPLPPINELWRVLSHWQQPVGKEADVFNTGKGPGRPPPPRRSSSISVRGRLPLLPPLPLSPVLPMLPPYTVNVRCQSAETFLLFNTVSWLSFFCIGFWERFLKWVMTVRPELSGRKAE